MSCASLFKEKIVQDFFVAPICGKICSLQLNFLKGSANKTIIYKQVAATFYHEVLAVALIETRH